MRDCGAVGFGRLRGYDLDRTDDESIARAVKMLLADAVLEGA